MAWLTKYRSEIISVLLIGAFMTVLAPYDTEQLPIWGRYLYWTVLMGVGWGSAAFIRPVLNAHAPGMPDWAHILILSLAVSIPVTAGVCLIQWFWGPGFPLEFLPIVFSLVWVISIAVTVIGYLADRKPAASVAEAEPPTISASLLDQLPLNLKHSPILALESEDHYLRVHCENGDALILMRLRDAMAALPEGSGEQTHRSWWVARDAVTRVERSQGRAQLTLKNGVTAPVSRTFAPKLREAGWFQ